MSAEILAALKRIEAKLDAVLAKRQQEERSKPAKATENVASDQDMDGKHGDPKVRTMPRDWTGDNFKGASYSQCPADLLDMVANMLEYFASKNSKNDTQKAAWDRLDAARARGWAIRKRNGWKPAEGNQETPASSYDFDEPKGGAYDDGDVNF